MSNIIFNKEDFADLRYNVMAYDGNSSLLEHFKDFKSSDEFQLTISWDDENKNTHVVDKDKAIKYMVLVYDPESPIKKKIPDDVTQRQQAALLAGFKTKTNGKFSPEVDKLMRCQLSGFNDMLIRYLRFFNNPTFSMLVVTTQAFYNKMQAVLDTDADTGTKKSALENEKIRGDLMKQADELLTNINIYQKRLLQGDKNPFLQEHLYVIVDKEASKLKINPESMAKVRKEAKPSNNKIPAFDED